MGKREPWVSWAMELQSLAQSALYYCKDPYDIERFQRIREISAEMLAFRSALPLETVKALFCNETGYQTPKIDTRAAVFRQGKILLVHERSGAWSLPGGWCDVDRSPAENVVKEVKEEAGVDVAVKSVISVQDRDKHNEPPYAYGITKIFFLCEASGGAFVPNPETTEAAYFPEDALPPLAADKCSAEQVAMCFAAGRDANWKTQFD